MTVRDFLKVFDCVGLKAIYYMEDDDQIPLWEGSAYETPWWVAEYELAKDDGDGGEPISYRGSLGKEYNDSPGLVFSLKESKED